MQHIIKTSCFAALFLVGIFIAANSIAQGFLYSSATAFSPNALQYVVGQQNVQQINEGDGVTYWGPSGNGVQGTLTYEFNFGAPSTQISLTAWIGAWNFNGGGLGSGSGTGSSSLWASVNGSSWQLLLNDPTPSDSTATSLTYNQNLPSSLLGSSSLWIQVDMEENGAPNGGYTVAQFLRQYSGNPTQYPAFTVDATVVPESSTTSLLCIGLAILVLFRRNRLFFRLVQQ
jgi:hypothetical protein